MSLFLAKTYWSTLVAKEEFDEAHLQVDNGKVYVGSYSGILRVYQPERGEFKPGHLRGEYNLNYPIMQILIGCFGQSTICVLQFKRLLFYSSEMDLIKEHALPRNAFNMCSGSFGGAKKTLICIQSCDAMLMIYQLEQLLYKCQLSTEYFPLPGPLQYSVISDSFILQNSCYEIESYKFSYLASIDDTQKRAQPNWICNVGEQAQKIIEVESMNCYFIICEQLLFQISVEGAIINQKRLDYPPASLMIGNNNLLIISSFTHHLMIYKDLTLVWAAKTDHISHGIMLSNFGGIDNFIVSLNDEGYLSILFLGTEQMNVQQELKQEVQMSYSQMDQLYSETLKEINKKESLDQNNNNNKNKQDLINLQIQIIKTKPTKEYVEDQENYFQANGLVIQTHFQLIINSTTILQNLTIHLNHDKSIFLDQTQLFIDIFHGGKEPLIFDVKAYSTKYSLIDRQVHVVAVWKNGSYETTFRLPLSQFCYKIQPNKEAKYKITLGIQKFNIFDLFDDIKSAQNVDITNVMTLQLCDRQASIVLSQQGDKIRIQSDNFESIAFLLNELILRCKDKIQMTNDVPLKDYFDVIDEHFRLKQIIKDQESELEQKAAEFRVIEKKLLARYKENNPTSLKSLDTLLEIAFKQFIVLMENTQKNKQEYEDVEHKLKGVTHLIVQLVMLRFGLKDDNLIDLFKSQNDWEEDVFRNINYYMRKQIPEVQQEDSSKIKKIITLLLDRLAKGQ